MKLTVIINLIVILTGVVMGYGQPLGQLLEAAAENNAELKALHQEYLAALERAPQVSQMPDPTVNAGIFVLQPETRVGPQWAKVGASQMFPWKGTLKAREDVVLAMAKVRFEKIRATQLNLFYEIKQAYFRLYEFQKKEEIIRRNIRVFEALERYSLSKVESGKGSIADVLRVQLKIQELEQEISIIENQKSKPVITINQLLNRPLEMNVEIVDSLSMTIIPFNKDSLGYQIMETHPGIREFGQQQEVSKRAIELNRFEGKPTFGVGLDYVVVTKRKDVEIPKNGRDILMPMATMKIPFNRKKYKAKQREEELVIAALETRKQDLNTRFISMIEKAYTDHQDAVLKLELYSEQKKTIQGIIEILESEYSASGRNFDELLRLQNDLVNYDLKILEAIVKSHVALASIERFVL